MTFQSHSVRMTKVVTYIENNLDTEISIRYLQSLACYSEFHFHRVFRAFVGESVYAYKKRLLLERAVKLLRYSNESMTEIALKSGYENSSSFNKAFKKWFSCTPSQVRKQNALINLKHSSLDKIESIEMKPVMRLIEDINVVYAREQGAYADAAPAAWGKVMKFAYSNGLMNKVVQSIGISHDDPSVTEPDRIRYDACLDIKNERALPDGLMSQTIKGGNYAVFLHKGAYEKFPESYRYILSQWLPESGYTLCEDKVFFEVYLNRDPRRTKPENLKTEIYIPIAS